MRQLGVLKEFFEMPAEDKSSVYSEDLSKSCRLCTSTVHYDDEKIHYWRDILRHPCHPLEEWIKQWPEKPTRYREVVGAYSIESKKLGSMILELISEGLGLETSYFKNELSETSVLSVFKDGEWIGVEPIPNAFVINIGYALQIISNKKLKSAEHRAVTNSKDTRTTAAFFLNPTTDSIIEPAKALTGPPIFRACQYKELVTRYHSMSGDTEQVLKPFKL
ncbi:hypothetical protein Patl1_17039 [Pistacia atlantica]|uniref:Uncharacterized protein n=1 Tax=Pistacia atlantica TaxID=434234 RepID=A0ACC1B8W3_9ROSI|nr:hypothetical protein Patl1_17039 [Pistacia atlantica]